MLCNLFSFCRSLFLICLHLWQVNREMVECGQYERQQEAQLRGKWIAGAISPPYSHHHAHHGQTMVTKYIRSVYLVGQFTTINILMCHLHGHKTHACIHYTQLALDKTCKQTLHADLSTNQPFISCTRIWRALQAPWPSTRLTRRWSGAFSQNKVCRKSPYDYRNRVSSSPLDIR